MRWRRTGNGRGTRALKAAPEAPSPLLRPHALQASLGVGVAGCISVAIDVEALLRRVVAEVFDADVDATYSTEPKAPHMHRVRLTSADGQRHAGLRASYEWFDADIFDLGVSTFLVDYDHEEADKEAVLRDLALVVRAYLGGEGCVERRRGLIRSHPVLKIVVDGQEWVLRVVAGVGPTTPTRPGRAGITSGKTSTLSTTRKWPLTDTRPPRP